mmetsp:Transcript_6087/g.7471  ORF Transcript_6087/g.7471 Transcript_6087/m.7471 type:complete len:377 (+) Transcript_6087:71-1201(+)
MNAAPSVPFTIDPKISDLINDYDSNKPWVAFEFFPPRTKTGMENLRSSFSQMKLEGQPMYAGVTWGACGTTSEASMDLAISIRNDNDVPTNLHLTCTNMEISNINEALNTAKDAGIRNICALRGDPPKGKKEVWGEAGHDDDDSTVSCALDLVQYIRKTFNNHDFCISVAGYPEGHSSKIKLVKGGMSQLSESEKTRCSVIRHKQEEDRGEGGGGGGGMDEVYVCSDEDFADELNYLKAKVDAGADFIITQIVFDAATYATFVTACRDIGITVPIIPGVMCINSYHSFMKMTQFCKLRVPDLLFETMEKLKHDKDGVKNFGIEFIAEMCRKCLVYGAPGFHFYTLNLPLVPLSILKELELLNEPTDESKMSNLIIE